VTGGESTPDRLARGAFETPPLLARFIARRALTAWLGARPERLRPPAAAAALARLDRARLCDPACGSGAFLLAARAELTALRRALGATDGGPGGSELWGVDVDAAAVARARAQLGTQARLAVGDAVGAFDWRAWQPGGFDLVLANPPYVRQERLGGRKAELARRWGGRLGGGCDLAAYFYLLGIELLRPGGLHAFIASDSWLDVAYGAPLRRILAAECRLLSLWRFDAAAFDEALVHTVVSLARRSPPGRWSPVALVQMAGLPPECRVQSRRLVPQRRLAEAERWGGGQLRGGGLYERILAAAGDRLAPLAQVAALRRGWSSGANAFFYVQPLEIAGDEALVRCADGSQHRLPAAALGPPVLLKAGEVLTPRLDASQLRHRLVNLPPARAAEPRAAAYLAWGAAKGFADRPSIAGRRCWHEAQPGGPAPLLAPIAHKRRPVLAWGDALWGSDNFVAVNPRDPADEGLLAALLLSTFALLAYESLGRANFGQGLLKTQVYELARLPVPAPAAVSPEHRQTLVEAAWAVAARPSEILYNDVKRADRRALDAALLAALGVELAVEELGEAACAAVWERQSRGAGNRESRVRWEAWRAMGVAF
jgi:methylase of polypeptide subunit release factors